MNVMYVNTLEKKVEEDRVKSAQISISENKGRWHVLWSEPEVDGKMMQEEWYNGISWDEMLPVYQQRLLEKLTAGYSPWMDTFWDRLDKILGKTALRHMLSFYSEQHPNDECYEQLREWRNKESSREGKSPFILATNRVLKLISTFLPQTEEELLSIPGLGEHKTRLYGEEICKITKEWERSTTFPLQWVEDKINKKSFGIWFQQQLQQKDSTEKQQKEKKKRCLEGIAKGENIASLQKSISVSRREIVQWIETLEKDGYDVESVIEDELQAIDQKDVALAWKAYEKEGDQYLKPIFQTVYGKLEMKKEEIDQAYEWIRLLRLKFRQKQVSVPTGES